MKLSLVTETFPPEVNGVAMTLRRLVDGMAARGHSVQVVRPRQNKTDNSKREGDIEHLVVPGIPLPKYEGLKVGLPAAGRLKRNWKADRPDVVHIATEGPLGWSALRAAEALQIPVSSSFHTNFHTYSAHYGVGFIKGLFVWHLRRIHNRCRVTMVPSVDVKDTLTAEGYQRVTVLARGVDANLFNPQRRSASLRQRWGATPETPVVAYVGRMAAEKNIELAVKAFEAMRAIRSDLKFVLVGDGPARAGIEARHPDYIYAGMQRGEALAEHYASADIFLFPSVTETFGNVVTEAMASGLCVVAYDYAAPRAFIEDGISGLLVPFDEAEAFVNRATQLLTAPHDHRAMGTAAAQVTRAITWDAIIDRFAGLLDEVKHTAVD